MINPKPDNWLFTIRKRLGLSRRALARLLGISASTIANIELDYCEGYSNKTFACLEVFELPFDVVVGLRPLHISDNSYYDQLRQRLGITTNQIKEVNKHEG